LGDLGGELVEDLIRLPCAEAEGTQPSHSLRSLGVVRGRQQAVVHQLTSHGQLHILSLRAEAVWFSSCPAVFSEVVVTKTCSTRPASTVLAERAIRASQRTRGTCGLSASAARISSSRYR